MVYIYTFRIIVTPKNSDVDGHIKIHKIDIEFNNTPNNIPHKIKLYNVATTKQK